MSIVEDHKHPHQDTSKNNKTIESILLDAAALAIPRAVGSLSPQTRTALAKVDPVVLAFSMRDALLPVLHSHVGGVEASLDGHDYSVTLPYGSLAVMSYLSGFPLGSEFTPKDLQGVLKSNASFHIARRAMVEAGFLEMTGEVRRGALCRFKLTIPGLYKAAQLTGAACRAKHGGAVQAYVDAFEPLAATYNMPPHIASLAAIQALRREIPLKDGALPTSAVELLYEACTFDGYLANPATPFEEPTDTGARLPIAPEVAAWASPSVFAQILALQRQKISELMNLTPES